MTGDARIVVLISGHGSNLQALIDACAKDLPATIVAVFSNNPLAYGLKRAADAQIPTHALDHAAFSTRSAFDQALCQLIAPYAPTLIVLAGFMRRLGSEFVRQFDQKIINIHPSLLPHYPGLQTHERVLAAGDRFHGVTVHVVTEALDAGPILSQAKIALDDQESVDSLRCRTQALEHVLYPAVIHALVSGIMSVHQGVVFFNECPALENGVPLARLIGHIKKEKAK